MNFNNQTTYINQKIYNIQSEKDRLKEMMRKLELDEKNASEEKKRIEKESLEAEKKEKERLQKLEEERKKEQQRIENELITKHKLEVEKEYAEYKPDERFGRTNVFGCLTEIKNKFIIVCTISNSAKINSNNDSESHYGLFVNIYGDIFYIFENCYNVHRGQLLAMKGLINRFPFNFNKDRKIFTKKIFDNLDELAINNYNNSFTSLLYKYTKLDDLIKKNQYFSNSNNEINCWKMQDEFIKEIPKIQYEEKLKKEKLENDERIKKENLEKERHELTLQNENKRSFKQYLINFLSKQLIEDEALQLFYDRKASRIMYDIMRSKSYDIRDKSFRFSNELIDSELFINSIFNKYKIEKELFDYINTQTYKTIRKIRL